MSKDKSKYKDTLNLPKTTFDMRAGLIKKEPTFQQRWRKEDLYGQLRKYRAGSPRFILHDGPPYANGNIHMGTALNKILKDMVVRIKNMTGFDAPYVPGWDCHGLPIEAKVVDELGDKARQMAATDIRKLCEAYANKFVAIQSEQFQRLGIFGEFDDPYITMRPQYEADVLEVFARLVDQGVVYRQLKPVHWSIDNRTALADAELEYHDRQDPGVTVAFELASGLDAVPHTHGDFTALGIWTTTPWTLPANLAVAIHPAYDYVTLRLESTSGLISLIVAADRCQAILDAIAADRGDWLTNHSVSEPFKGQRLLDAKVTYRHPLIDGKVCPVVAADYVTLEDGTGLVHTSPGHGLDDYHTGLANGLDIYCPVTADGTFDETAPEFIRGVSVWDANGLIIEHLRTLQTLIAAETIMHSYPHDWRSKTPTIFRATEQWFIAVDKPLAETDESLRAMALKLCNLSEDRGVRFIPGWGRNRIVGMLESRPDWCLSRQRSWGLPIPVFYNRDGRSLLTPDSVRAVMKVIAQEGSNAWFTKTPAELLADYDADSDPRLDDPGEFPLDELEIGRDIFDVWFESGSSWYAVAIARGLAGEMPVDLYLEGSDQHRGWFQLSLLPALGAVSRPPFKTVLTHGFVVTEDGHKMSKSLGNAIDVVDQLNTRGADILRLWVASQNYQDDIRCSDSLIAQAEDAYRKIRNTLRFCMGSCSDFDPARHAARPGDHSIDLWMRLELHELIRNVRAAYDTYEFHRATRLMYEFCTVQASSVYMAAVKDRLYCEHPESPRRRATQTVMHEMLMTLVKLLAPILPHTCEEAWEHIPFRDVTEPHSVHLASLPDVDTHLLRLAEELRPVAPDAGRSLPDQLTEGATWIWDRLLDLRTIGLGKLEDLRNAGVKNPLDTEAVFLVPEGDDAVRGFIELYLAELEDMLGVGHARIDTGPAAESAIADVTVHDTRDQYERCARSWKRRPDVGSDPDYPDLSARDAAAVRLLGGS
ncbi:hypothetical protein LCGC14_0276790 [marine sediment metagenome]|uniref:isoleucine--tRNA ligase n=1 Tax=marine sediment metagenome TaxID=412755 RepID=A0A0F9TXC8_9ZZZZ